MADRPIETKKTSEAKAETLPAVDVVKAPVAEPAKPEPVKAAPVAAPAKTVAAKPVAKAAARKAKKPARRAASRKTIKRAKPAKKPTTARKARPVRAGATIIRTGVTNMNKQTNKAAETAQIAADQIKTVIGDVNARAKTAMEKNAKIAEEFAEITRGNVEALVASTKVAAKGVETMSQGAAEYGRKSFEDASAAFKSFSDVKSATDFFRLQGDFARSAFDAAVAESARVSETVLKLAGDVAEPLTSRYTVAAERVKTLAA